MRLSSGTLLLGIFAVMFGLLGAYAVRKELHKPAEKTVAVAAKVETVTVPVASQNLEAGRKLTLGDVVIMKLTPAQMKAQKISGSFMGSPKQIIGRIVKTPMREGATFDSPNFYPEGTGPSLTDRLKPGFRAVTITVDQDAAVAGFAIPGSLVDVLFRADAVTPANSDSQDQLPEVTVTLIEGAEVLALDKDMTQSFRIDSAATPNPNGKTSVTLAVTQRQAVALQVAEGRGAVSLSLRGKDDRIASRELTGVNFVAERTAQQLANVVTKSVSDPHAADEGRQNLPSRNEITGEPEVAKTESLPQTLDDLLSRSNTVHHKMEIYRGRQLRQTHFRNYERTTPPDPVIAEPNPVPSPGPQTAEQPSPTAPATLSPPRLTIVSPRNAKQ